MKFNCSLTSFLGRLKLANEVVSSKNSVGLFNSILIRANKNHYITVQSTDTKISFNSVFAAEVLEEGEILVFCGRLMGILGTMKDGDICFHSDDEQGLLHIEPLTGQKLKLELRLLSRDRFPHMPEIADSEYFEVGQETFLDMIHNTSFSVSHDETRYYLTGCYLERSEDAFTMVATDAKRLALFHTEEQDVPIFDGVIIPPKVLHFLSKVTGGEGNLKIAVTPKRIYFKVDEYDISSVLIDGKFPEYNKILPKSSESCLVLNREEFYEAVHRISIMTEQDSKTCSLVVRGNNTLMISAKGNETGSAEEEISYEGEPAKEISLVLTSRHLLEPMKQMKASKIVLEYSSPKDPVKLQAEGELRYFHIFMPLSQDE
ncbi:DNA polymerase III subunit beta [Candidatus Haliotispira prima]|uniref:Beta sliding clamp n=1 Tax=Candidatus Haliotispira prima TaxID=3034016 RepID=A0ABY8MGB5_9SPIO|nr:DNA polymerase III subunit beta [Candidatus Haliotispira prima]